jgi:hypothetical protein
MSQSKFVSSIPNNNLAPVFLGGGEGPSSKSGVYIPSFLQGKNKQDQNNKDTCVVKDFKMTEGDFPSLGASKPSNTNTQTLNTFKHYSDALKKDIDKPKPKANKENGHSRANKSTNKKNKKQILDHYSDYDSDDHFMDTEPF